MQKQNYLTPFIDIVGVFGESAVLTGSSGLGAAAEKNPNYIIGVGADDSEFE